MAEERTKRKNETRETQKRPSDDWAPQSILPDPEPQPGWEFRWIRTDILGQSDNTNVSKQSDVGSRFEGNVHIGGLLLCKAPKEKMESRTNYFQGVAANQMESVDNNFLRENDPRMPLSQPERSTRTTFGKS